MTISFPDGGQSPSRVEARDNEEEEILKHITHMHSGQSRAFCLLHTTKFCPDHDNCIITLHVQVGVL
jgi:hypothetical protein